MTPLPSPVVMTVSPEAFCRNPERDTAPAPQHTPRAGGLDLLEFPRRVRFAAAGIDRLDQNFVFVHKPLHSFLVSVFSIPQAVQSMQE